MDFLKNTIEGLLIIKPRVFEDERGHFYESYKKELFENNGIPFEFIQDNQSLSQKDVLRGLHFQNPPFAQGKLIRVIRGSALDVAVDIRKNSPTYGKYSSIVLSEVNKLMYWVPSGFAHGFLTLEDNTILQYKCTALYNKESEGSLLWNDPNLKINWGINHPLLSDKDIVAPTFAGFNSMF
jgi:dTDP-4-dehydrorhamnose 3,5-epimerase